MISLRPYQSRMVEEARAARRLGHKAVLLQAPTGAGKTIIAAHILASAVNRGSRTWMLCHRIELIEQICAALRLAGCPYWVAKAGHARLAGETPGRGVMVGSVQTVTRRIAGRGKLAKLKEPNLIIWDECHHIAAGSWTRVFAEFPQARHLGLSATPRRLDGSGLGPYFGAIVKGPSTADLIEIGALSPYRLFAPPAPDMSKVHIRAGEYVASEAEQVVRSVTGDVLVHYRTHANGLQALAFCVSRAHSKEIAAMFMSAGIQAVHVDAETPADIRGMHLKEFREKKIRILCNVDLFGEGVDIPGIGALIMLRPTVSEGVYLQQVGRVLRPALGKECAIILDHVGNVERHGLPDAARVWSLAYSKKKRATKEAETLIRIRVCPKCFAAQAPAIACRFCGEVFELQGRHIETRAGELVEVQLAPLPPNPWGNRVTLASMFRLKGMAPQLAAALAAKIERQRAAKGVLV